MLAQTHRPVEPTELTQLLLKLLNKPKEVLFAVSEEDPQPCEASLIFIGPYTQVFDPIETAVQPIVGSNFNSERIEMVIAEGGQLHWRPHRQEPQYGNWKPLMLDQNPLYAFVVR